MSVDVDEEDAATEEHTIGVNDGEDIEVIFVDVAFDFCGVGIVVEQVVSEILDGLHR